MTRGVQFVVAGLVIGFGASAALGQQYGNLKGQFIFDGKAPAAMPLNVNKDPETCGKHNLVDESLVVSPEGGLANVVIYVRTKNVKAHPEYAKNAKANVELDNKNCRFEPHILPMLTTQTLVIKNSDPVGHNTNASPIGDKAFNPLIPANAQAQQKFAKAQTLPQPVACNIHPWMKAYVLPRDNPYFAVSDADGKFEIKNLPAGEIEFQVWQEKSGYLDAAPGSKKGRFTMTIKPGDNDLGVMKIKPAAFAK